MDNLLNELEEIADKLIENNKKLKQENKNLKTELDRVLSEISVIEGSQEKFVKMLEAKVINQKMLIDNTTKSLKDILEKINKIEEELNERE